MIHKLFQFCPKPAICIQKSHGFLACGLIRSAYIWTLEGLNLKKYKPFIRNVRYVEFFISFLVFWPLDKCPHGKLVVNKSRNSVIGRLTVHHYLENYIYHFGMAVRLSPPSNDKLGRGGRAWTFFVEDERFGFQEILISRLQEWPRWRKGSSRWECMYETGLR